MGRATQRFGRLLSDSDRASAGPAVKSLECDSDRDGVGVCRVTRMGQGRGVADRARLRARVSRDRLERRQGQVTARPRPRTHTHTHRQTCARERAVTARLSLRRPGDGTGPAARPVRVAHGPVRVAHRLRRPFVPAGSDCRLCGVKGALSESRHGDFRVAERRRGHATAPGTARQRRRPPAPARVLRPRAGRLVPRGPRPRRLAEAGGAAGAGAGATTGRRGSCCGPSPRCTGAASRPSR